VSQDFELRKVVRGAAGLSCVKNNIAEKALPRVTPSEAVLKDLKGMCSLAFTASDPGGAGQVRSPRSQGEPGVQFRAGFVEGRPIDLKSIQDLRASFERRDFFEAAVPHQRAPAQRL